MQKNETSPDKPVIAFLETIPYSPSPNDPLSKRPYLLVEFENGRASQLVMLVDTGADISVIDQQHFGSLKPVDTGKNRTVKGIKGQEVYRIYQVRMHVAPLSSFVTSEAIFIADLKKKGRDNLLGRNGLMERLIVAFDEYEQKLYITLSPMGNFT